MSNGEDFSQQFRAAAELVKIFETCWRDEDYKSSFKLNARAFLEEAGFQLPDGVDVVVVENAPNVLHLVLPAPALEAPDAVAYGSVTIEPLPPGHHRSVMNVVF